MMRIKNIQDEPIKRVFSELLEGEVFSCGISGDEMVYYMKMHYINDDIPNAVELSGGYPMYFMDYEEVYSYNSLLTLR